MTSQRAKINLSKAVNQVGVLFTALSRVRHPDDLLLDDEFPTLYQILQQTKGERFQQRMRWEKMMRVKFT